MPRIKDDLIAGKIRDVEKAQRRVHEAVDTLHDEVALALKEKRITPKEAAAVRSGLKRAR